MKEKFEFNNLQSAIPNKLLVVRSNHGFQHVDEDGHPSYEKHFSRADPFQEGVAAVSDFGVSYHIHPDGRPVYSASFDWVGSFQGGKALAISNGAVFKIDKTGQAVED